MNDRMEFSAGLARLRQQAGMKKAAVAQASGLLPSQVTDVEKGLKNFSMETLGKYLGAIGMRLVDLLPQADEKRGPGRPVTRPAKELPALFWEEAVEGGWKAVETIDGWNVTHYLREDGSWYVLNSAKFEVASGAGGGKEAIEAYRRERA